MKFVTYVFIYLLNMHKIIYIQTQYNLISWVVLFCKLYISQYKRHFSCLDCLTTFGRFLPHCTLLPCGAAQKQRRALSDALALPLTLSPAPLTHLPSHSLTHPPSGRLTHACDILYCLFLCLPASLSGDCAVVAPRCQTSLCRCVCACVCVSGCVLYQKFPFNFLFRFLFFLQWPRVCVCVFIGI